MKLNWIEIIVDRLSGYAISNANIERDAALMKLAITEGILKEKHTRITSLVAQQQEHMSIQRQDEILADHSADRLRLIGREKQLRKVLAECFAADLDDAAYKKLDTYDVAMQLLREYAKWTKDKK